MFLFVHQSNILVHIVHPLLVYFLSPTKDEIFEFCVILVRAVTLASRYLIQSYGKFLIFQFILISVYLGCGKSKVTHLSRVDLMGRSQEWYSKVYGSILTRSMNQLRDSFIHINTGPETKV